MMETEISYQDGDTNCKAFVAYPAGDTTAPAVLIMHAWAGRDQFACDKAKAFAQMGYVGIALDNYGDAKLGSSNEENAAMMNPLLNDRNNALLPRLQAGFNMAKDLERVDANNMVVIGYCFGGLCALDLARSGAELKGAVSFHGFLHPPENSQPNIKGKILALHGHLDPMIEPQIVFDFEREMRELGCDWQLHVFGDCKHAFTNPGANDETLGTVYNAAAEKRSWIMLKHFLEEAFA